MRVVLAGASGLLGTALRESLDGDGHDVVVLVRRPPTTTREQQWDPAAGRLAPDAVAGADAVVCLSGAGVADRRWTESYKRTLRASRLDSVATIARTMAEIGGPGVLLSASAVGYYGDTGETEIDESAPRGDGFLAQLCEDWEAAAQPAVQAGVRVAHLRTGIVLTRRGGLLKRLVPIVKIGVLSRLGSGRQYLPWISLADEIAAMRFLIEHEVHGPVNLTGPDPARNAELISTLARLLHRPALAPAPAIALKLVLGELAQDALGGQRAIPAALTGAGFVHQHAELAPALQWALRN